MRTYGEINGVSFKKIRFSIYAHSYEYKLNDGYSSKTVYADNMTELKKEISLFNGEAEHEQGEIQVRSMSDQREA